MTDPRYWVSTNSRDRYRNITPYLRHWLYVCFLGCSRYICYKHQCNVNKSLLSKHSEDKLEERRICRREHPQNSGSYRIFSKISPKLMWSPQHLMYLSLVLQLISLLFWASPLQYLQIFQTICKQCQCSPKQCVMFHNWHPARPKSGHYR